MHAPHYHTDQVCLVKFSYDKSGLTANRDSMGLLHYFIEEQNHSPRTDLFALSSV
jgi:hypothetical protein